MAFRHDRFNHLNIAIISIVAMALVTNSGAASEQQSDVATHPGWPQLRGPTYDGISPESKLADSWPAEGPPVLWVRDFGEGYSSFAVFDDRLYTQMQTLLGQYVVCLDAKTGKTLWEHRYGLPYEPAGLYPGPRATPTLREGRIYFATPDGLIGCLDASDGEDIWSRNVNAEFHGRGTDFGYSASPVVDDGKVIVPVGGKGASVVALSAIDGSVVWKSGDEPASYCSVLPISFRGHNFLVALLQNSLTLFDLKTGALVWQRTDSLGYDEHAAAPLYNEPFLLIASPFRNGAKVFRLETPKSKSDSPVPTLGELNSVAGQVVWESSQLSNDVASSVLFDGFVYGFDLRDVQAKAHRPSRGEFRCLQWSDGKVRWSSAATGHSTVLVADGKLILFNDKGQLLLVRATADDYQELARTDVFGTEICWTSPALDSNRLFLRTHSRAACLYLGPPEELSEDERNIAIAASAIPKLTTMNWLLLLGRERDYLFDPPTLEQLWRWYLACLVVVFIPAAGVALIAGAITGKLWPEQSRYVAACVFTGLSVTLGTLATPFANRVLEDYYFTWPATLFMAFQFAIVASVRWGRSPIRRERILARVAGFALLAIFAGYFWLCRRLSLHHEWAFLMGGLPAFPLAILVARSRSMTSRAFWGLAAFSLFYWSVGGWMFAKSQFHW